MKVLFEPNVKQMVGAHSELFSLQVSGLGLTLVNELNVNQSNPTRRHFKNVPLWTKIFKQQKKKKDNKF